MWSAAKNVELLAFKEFLHNMPPYDNTCLQSLVMPSELVDLLFSVANIHPLNIHPLNIHPPAQHENNQYSKWQMTVKKGQWFQTDYFSPSVRKLLPLIIIFIIIVCAASTKDIIVFWCESKT